MDSRVRNPNEGSEDILLTTTDIAERLKVTEKTVRNWIETGMLEGYKLGKNYRVKQDALETFLEKSKIKNH